MHICARAHLHIQAQRRVGPGERAAAAVVARAVELAQPADRGEARARAAPCRGGLVRWGPQESGRWRE